MGTGIESRVKAAGKSFWGDAWDEFKLFWHYLLKNPRCKCGHAYSCHAAAGPTEDWGEFCDALLENDLDCPCQNFVEAQQ